MAKKSRDRELERARTAFRNIPDSAYRQPGPGDGGQQILQQMALDPNAVLMMQNLAMVDTAWAADLLLARPDWDSSVCYFHTALIELSKVLILDFLHYVTMNKQFPTERLAFVKDLRPGEATIHERLELVDAAPANPDDNNLTSRIPFEKSPEGVVQVGEGGAPKRISPDALILLQTQNGKVDSNGMCHFTCNATLVTYGVAAAARIRVNFIEGIRVDKSFFLRPAEVIAEWEKIIPSRECSPKETSDEEAPKESLESGEPAPEKE